MSAKNGDTVKVHYTGKLSSGEVFDSSEGRDPIQFAIGGGQVIPGFEQGIEGMQIGDKKTVEISVDQAYGEYRDELIFPIGKDKLPAEINPEVGMQLTMNNPQGQVFPVTVKEITDDTIMLDANHKLAGKDLIFDLELVEIV